MKICAVSDTHQQEPDVVIPECDLLIHSGDIDARDLVDVIHFYRWFSKQPAYYKIYVPGNHDFFFESHLMLCREEMKDVHVLVNNGITIEGIKIWGSPITPTFFNWAFMADRGDEIKQYWDMIPNDIDVLVTHGPAYRMLDYINVKSGHVGCYDLGKAIERIRPKVHIFGHIHESHGKIVHTWETNKTTTFINASQLDGDYDLVHKPITIEI